MEIPDHIKREPDAVRTMFARIAPRYDKINRAMCFGMDRRWRKRLAQTALADSQKDSRILDLACGSGDITLEILKKNPDAKVTSCDLCEQMLDIAKEKFESEGLEAQIVCANAENLPFADSHFKICTIGFGFRNFADRAKCLAEIRRVLQADGKLLILEVARAHPLFEPIQNFFMAHIVPHIAGLLGANKNDYRYLAKTTRNFPRKKELEKLLTNSGFQEISTKNFAFGFVAITTASKK